MQTTAGLSQLELFPGAEPNIPEDKRRERTGETEKYA
jgi:hypothetical protein